MHVFRIALFNSASEMSSFVLCSTHSYESNGETHEAITHSKIEYYSIPFLSLWCLSFIPFPFHHLMQLGIYIPSRHSPFYSTAGHLRYRMRLSNSSFFSSCVNVPLKSTKCLASWSNCFRRINMPISPASVFVNRVACFSSYVAFVASNLCSSSDQW